MAKQFGRYELVREVGRGGQAIVYEARDHELRRTVALKVLLPGVRSEDGLRRFEREGRAAAKLNHPNIVTVYDTGSVRETHFMAMEFVEGEPLDEVLDSRRPGVREAFSLVEEVAEAVDYAHSQGVIHRDIKPANILLTPDGEPKLSDFGFALDIDAATQLTQSGTIMGTPSYMPPEQAKGRAHRVDARSDVYSLGAVLYEMLTGRPPFRAETQLALLEKIVYEAPKRPSEIKRTLPPDAETIALKCLEKEPDRRYQTARELADDCRRFVGGEPIAGRRASVFYTVKRKLVRHKGVAAVSAVAAIALFCLGAWIVSLQGKLAEKEKASERGHAAPARMKEEGGRMRTSSAVSLPPSSSRARGTRTDSRARLKDEGGRMKPSSAVSLPPSSLLRSASAFRDAEEFDSAHPKDTEGAIRRYDKVAEDFPGTIEAGKARINVIRLGTRLARPEPKPKVAAARPPGIPPDAVPFGGHWYKVYSKWRTWHDAKRFCEEKGGHLVTITSKEENDFVVALARGHEDKVGVHYWLGLSDERTEGRFEWVTGEPLAFTGWAKGQPGNLGRDDEDYVFIQEVLGFAWADVPSNAGARFICEWEPAAPRPPGIVSPEQVHAALKAANPGYNGKGRFKIKGGRIVEVDFKETGLTDISPLRGMDLEVLRIHQERKMSDISALRGMRLNRLWIVQTKVRDISAIEGMPLRHLRIGGSPVSDISVLKGMPLEVAYLGWSNVADISVLRGMPLKEAYLGHSQISDISVLRGMALTHLTIEDCPIQNVTALEGMHLEELYFSPERITRGLDVVRRMKSLKKINEMPADLFWKEYGATLGAAPSGPRPRGSPEDAVFFGGHWYKLYTQKMTWHDAKRFCEGRGGHLVTITSNWENSFLRNLVRSSKLSMWIGFTDEGHEGVWEWVTGEKVTFTRWADGEPSNQEGSEHCASLRFWGDSWNDLDGSRKYPFICEWEPAAPAAEGEWQTIFNGRDLTGWKWDGVGKAYVEDSALVSTGCADLYYRADWAEFVLDCEVSFTGRADIELAHQRWGRNRCRVRIALISDGDCHVYGPGKLLWRSGNGKFPPNRWMRLTFELTRDALRVRKNGQLTGTMDLSAVPVKKGGVYFYSCDKGSTARLRNIRVRVISR